MGRRKNAVPLLEKLHQYVQSAPARFHVPGHKGLCTSSNEMARRYFASLFSIDVTELSGLDDLHAPQTVIAEARRLAAACFHADETFFLVNGSTVGNLAMILGSIEKGVQVLVQRNSHKSIFHGLAMAEAEAIFLEPELCPIFGVPVGISMEQFRVALTQYPEAKALILTYPNYYGMAIPLQEIISLAHERHLLVLVDEAHGAHFGLHVDLPPSAMQLGADVSVQSTHKMLGSLTQTSMLHIQGERVVKEDIAYYLQSLQSSSPSYPLMASLDLARAQVEEMSANDWQQVLAANSLLRQELERLSSFQISSAGMLGGHSKGMMQDPFKLIIQPTYLGLSGYQLQQALEAEGIFVELADPFNILCTLPLVVQQDWNNRLIQALTNIQNKEHDYTEKHNYTKEEYLHLLQEYAPYKQEKLATSKVKLGIIPQHQKEKLPLRLALGRMAAEMIVPYPPGIPLLFPGQIISQEIVEQIIYLEHLGATMQGRSANDETSIWVRKN